VKRNAGLWRGRFFNLQSGIDNSAVVASIPENPMPSFRFFLVPGITLLLMAPAMAQTVGQAAGQRQETWVRVQTTFNFVVPGPTGDSEQARKSADSARRSIYEMAAHECDLLREVLAKDCRIEQVSSNIGRQFGQQQPDGYTVNGSMNFSITVK
jgi:hypothetical protein